VEGQKKFFASRAREIVPPTFKTVAPLLSLAIVIILIINPIPLPKTLALSCEFFRLIYIYISYTITNINDENLF